MEPSAPRASEEGGSLEAPDPLQHGPLWDNACVPAIVLFPF